MSPGDDFVAAQRALTEDYGFDSYEAALRSWIATVAIVEVGYLGEWEEYALELTARDYLHELTRVSPSSRAAVEEDLALWDDRFLAATAGHPVGLRRRSPGRERWRSFRPKYRTATSAATAAMATNRSARCVWLAPGWAVGLVPLIFLESRRKEGSDRRFARPH